MQNANMSNSPLDKRDYTQSYVCDVRQTDEDSSGYVTEDSENTANSKRNVLYVVGLRIIELNLH